MNPLALNCQGYAEKDGKVIGVQLGITPVPGAKYEVYSVSLVDENNSGGNTVAYCSVIDKNGVSTGEEVRLTWPGKDVPFQDSGLAGNGRNEHVISNAYNPPAIGPLALHVGGFNKPTSDIVYGIGLPFKHHVSYRVIFREKGAVTNPTTPADPDLLARINALEVQVAWHEQRITKLEADDKRITALQSWAIDTSKKHPELPQFA